MVRGKYSILRWGSKACNYCLLIMSGKNKPREVRDAVLGERGSWGMLGERGSCWGERGGLLGGVEERGGVTRGC